MFELLFGLFTMRLDIKYFVIMFSTLYT